MTYHAVPPVRGILSVRADASAADLIRQVKSAVKEMRDELDSKAAKKDVVSREKIDRINASIGDLQSKLSDLANRAAASGLGGGRGSKGLTRRIAAFGRTIGRAASPEEYKAYRAALPVYLRKGLGTGDVRAAMSVVSDPDGGYTVTPDLTGRIVSKVFETSPMRQVASVVTIGTDVLEGFNDLDETAAGWVGEKAARTDTGTPGLGKWSIPVHEIYAQPKTTQKLLDDSSWPIESWLANKVADKFARTENASYVTGDGVLKPRGLLTYTTAATADDSRAWEVFEHVGTGSNGSFGTAPNGSDKLIDLVYKLKVQYRTKGKFMMRRSTLAEVRKLKDGQGNYLWQPDFGQFATGSLLGHEVIEAEDFPAHSTTGALAIAFGDFAEAYTIVDREGIRVLRDPFTDKPNVRFYTTKRTGGGAINFEAVKFLKMS